MTTDRGLDPARWRAPGAGRALADRAWARTWHCLGEVGALAEPGAHAPRTLLPGALDEPILLVHGPEGLRAFANVCTHRLATLVDAPGRGRAIVCPYHGRTFDLSGRCRGQRGFSGVVEGFPDADDHLTPIPLAVWAGLVFVAIDPSVPFEVLVAPVAAMLPALDLGAAIVEEGPTYDVDAPFLAWVENYLEGLHIPYVHPGLDALLDADGYAVRALPHGCSVQAGIADGATPALPPHPAWPGQRLAGIYAVLFPTTMINVYPWGVSLNLVQPVGADRCRIVYRAYVTDPAARSGGAGSDLVTVEAEDQAVVARVAAGMRSRLARAPRFAPDHEDGVAAYHAELGRQLSPPG